MTSRPIVVDDLTELALTIDSAVGRRAVVMTMGGLHSGHGELMDLARESVGRDGQVTVTVFVNPLQFAPTEDLDQYPRTFDADVDLCASHGVDVVFAPTNELIYPDGEPVVTVDPGALSQKFEGMARPDHFRGVLTVVSILMQMTRPDFAVFGEKDYQQLTLVRQMVKDLHLPVEIVAGQTAREPSGLAMSSRNVYLNDAAREAAMRMPAAIAAGVAAGPRGKSAVINAARAVLEAPSAGVDIDIQYVVVTDPQMGQPPRTGPARLILTAVFDGTRLLDNAAVTLGPEAAQ